MVIYANILSTGLMSKNLAFYAMLGRILSYSRPIQSMEEQLKLVSFSWLLSAPRPHPNMIKSLSSKIFYRDASMVSKQRDPLKKYWTADNVVLQLLTKNKQHTKNQWHISHFSGTLITLIQCKH